MNYQTKRYRLDKGFLDSLFKENDERSRSIFSDGSRV